MENVRENNSSFNKIINKIRAYLSKPANVILVFFTVLLTLLVLLPLLNFAIDSITVQTPGEASKLSAALGKKFEVGDITSRHWFDLMFNSKYDASLILFWKPMLNSIMLALGSCAIAVSFGGVVAWLITRTTLPCKKLISLVFVFPYMMPSWAIAMFWENFFKNSGSAACNYQVGILESLTGIKVPTNMLYGMIPAAICLGIHYAPFAYIFIGGILRNMDSNLEEAATILKTSKFRIFYRITVPIIMPAVISTVLLVFASSVSSFTVPTFLNRNGSINVLSLQLRSLMGNTRSYGQGFALAMVMLMFSVAIMVLSSWLTGKRKSFTTVTGKSGQVSKINFAPWLKYTITTVVLILVLFFAIVPLITFALESFLGESGNLSSFTTYYWTTSDVLDNRIVGDKRGILINTTIRGAFFRTLGLAGVVALCAGTLGILVGYAVARTRGKKLSNFISSLAFFPYLIPAMSFGAVFLSLSYTPAFSFLRGSFVLLVIVGMVKFLPFASRSGTNAMLQLSGEIEEAAILVATPWWKRMTRILFPIQKATFISGYLLPFVSCMREMSLFVLIAKSGSLLTVVLEDFQRNGVTQVANGINLIIVVMVIGVNLLVNKVTGASIDKGVGG